jgi:predicted double-glycine peptidase
MISRSVRRTAAGVFAALATLCATDKVQAQVRLAGDTGAVTVKVMTWRDIPFRTVVRQQHDYSCGSAALATLLTYSYGVRTTEADAFTAMYDTGDQAKIRKVGFSMLDMKRYVEAHGLSAHGYKMSLDEVASDGVPVIALITLGVYRHFVVIKGIEGDKVLIGDPALGLRILPKAAFMVMWNGVALQIDRTGEKARFNEVSEWQPWSRAPVRRAADTTSTVTSVTNNQFILYQITPVIDINFRPGG